MSRKHLQLQQLGGLVEASVETGKGQRKGKMLMQPMGSCQLNAVGAAQAKSLGKYTSFFNKKPSDESTK